MDPRTRLLIVGIVLMVALFIYFAGPGFFGLEVESPADEATPPPQAMSRLAGGD